MLYSIFKDEDNIIQALLYTYSSRYADQLKNDLLDVKEWKHLYTIYEYLSCFSSATLEAEGHGATLKMALDNIDICLEFLQEQKVYSYTIFFSFLILINFRNR